MKKGKVVFTLLVGVAFAALAFIPKTNDHAELEATSKKMEFFSASWEEAVEKAKSTDKLIFVDLYATWCGPCKMMKLHTFTNKEVGAFYNDYYINVALDGEKAKGAELMDKFGLNTFPSLLFINADGQLVAHAKGYHNPKQFLQLGKQIQSHK
jgi:thioredoxin 1